MQHVVYAKSSKVFAATSCCLLFIAMNRIKVSMRQLSTSLKRFSIPPGTPGTVKKKIVPQKIFILG